MKYGIFENVPKSIAIEFRPIMRVYYPTPSELQGSTP